MHKHMHTHIICIYAYIFCHGWIHKRKRFTNTLQFHGFTAQLHQRKRASQRVAVCCSALQGVAVRCSALQCVAVRCIVVQCGAVCCSVLQCVAVCCSVLQCIAVCCSEFISRPQVIRRDETWLIHMCTFAKSNGIGNIVVCTWYGKAMISRRLKNISLFCRI